MNTGHIKKARQSLKNAGTLEDRQHLRETLIARLKNDLQTLEEKINTIRSDFRRQLERWRTEHVPENVPVTSLPADFRDARLYRITAIFALLSEMGLAAWIFGTLGVSPILGALSGFLITFTLHGVFLQVLDSPDRPKETVWRIRTYVSLPATIGFLVALATGILGRYVYGAAAIALLPVFSLALWLGTLSLILLAASLFTLGHLKAWSARYEKTYRQFDDEHRETLDFLEELEREGATIADSPRPLPLPAAKEHHATLPVIALLAITLSGFGCAPNSTNPVEAATLDQPTKPAAELSIFIDWTGSPVRSALEESWQNVKAELPTIAETHNVGEVTIAAFDEDGWCPQTRAEIRLPILNLPPRPKKITGEWESFANIREALAASENETWQHQMAQVRTRYRQSLDAALAPLESVGALPDATHETRRSDVVGLLKRIAQTRSNRPQLYLVLTDLADTTHKTLPTLPTPEGETHVVVLLVPAKPKDATFTIGKPLAGAEQYELHSRQLQESAPWITPAPYFARNLSALFKP